MQKICIMSDSHDNLQSLRKAVALVVAEKPDLIIHLGDFVAPFTLPIIKSAGIKLLGIFGNNDGERKGLSAGVAGWGEIFDAPYLFKTQGVDILLSHSPIAPETIKSDYPSVSIFLHGHTHKSCDISYGSLRVINPGEVCGYLTGSGRFGILEIPSGDYKTFEIE